MNTEHMDRSFEEIKSFWEASSKKGRAPFKPIWARMHDLAERKYLPALQFFVEGFEQPDWSWRQEFLRLVGFHYYFSPESDIAMKIRGMLLHDPSSEVRITAAAVLGGRSSWPDRALMEALAHEQDPEVRKAVFASSLLLQGIPDQQAHRIVKDLLMGGIDLDPKRLKQSVEDLSTQ